MFRIILVCSFALMGLTGWDLDCVYREHGGTVSKMPALLQNFQVLLAGRIPRIFFFFQLQIRNAGRQTVQMIPFRIWKMLACLSPTSYLYTSYLCWEMFLWLLEQSPLFHAPSAVTSSKSREGGNLRGLSTVGNGAPAPSWSLKLPSKGWSRHRKGIT